MNKETTARMATIMTNTHLSPARARYLRMLSALGAALVALAVAANPAHAAFGIESFDGTYQDASGSPFTQAGGHPDTVTTDFALNTTEAPPGTPFPFSLFPIPDGQVKNAGVGLPAGFVGDPAATSKCSIGDLSYKATTPNCPPASQVGQAYLHLTFRTIGPIPIYNMTPKVGAVAEFGFNAIVIVRLSATVQSDNSIAISSVETSEGLPLAGLTTEFWGVPADHLSELGVTGLERKPLLRMPTSCNGPLQTTITMNQWENPANFQTASFLSHDNGEPPNPVGDTGCEGVQFTPSVSLQTTSHQADSPTGLDASIKVPSEGFKNPDGVSQADIRKVKLELPQGLSINPSSATGLGSCSAQQIGLATAIGSTPVRFNGAPVSCPDSSKIGTVQVKSPALEESLEGSVYLAKQQDNPFNSLLAMYVVAEAPERGVRIKLAGKIEAGAGGRLTTTFDENPQLPVEQFDLHLNSGPRAALRTPEACGTYTAMTELTPWSAPESGPPVTRSSSFAINSGPGGSPCPSNPAGFDPKLSGGSQSPVAGGYSPFSVRLTREDGTQQIGSLAVSAPQGVSAKLAGVPYCSNAALASVSSAMGSGMPELTTPTCPPASQVGTVTVGTGAGSLPYYGPTDKVYLAGPYKGAPISLAVIAPAVAGPFDLGNVLVRNAVRIDPETAQVTTVSDPLPSILFGIPLDLRDIRVELNRNQFTVNPTNCDPMQINSKITSLGGAVATPSQRYQVGDCGSLAFKPKLSLRLSGQTKRGGNPALRATLQMPSGPNANIAKAQVSLPHSEFVAQSHLADVCTRVQYAAGAGGGAGCPPNSVYGHARAFSPLLAQPLEGPVYLRSNGGERALPDLVASLGGQVHIDAVGYIGTNKKTHGLRTTFATVPDAPLEKVVISLPAGKHSLLENSTDICRGRHQAIVRMTAHDEATAASKTPLRANCGRKGGGGGR
ncbi:MAG: hypothetical protein ACTHKT_04395 [Solirubrobacterales bacterium]